jgi:hypothetical protein
MAPMGNLVRFRELAAIAFFLKRIANVDRERTREAPRGVAGMAPGAGK